MDTAANAEKRRAESSAIATEEQGLQPSNAVSFGRGIDYQLIQECIADGTIYESADYHNAVFVGKDKSGTAKYAALRSTLGSTFKQDASGSDKRYSFRLLAKEPTNTVHLFEAAIDLLSYATYLKCEGKDYRIQNLLSLSGVYQPKRS